MSLDLRPARTSTCSGRRSSCRSARSRPRRSCCSTCCTTCPDPVAFFRECERVLKPGAGCVSSSRYAGPLSRRLIRPLHHEPWDETAGWTLPPAGPLTGREHGDAVDHLPAGSRSLRRRDAGPADCQHRRCTPSCSIWCRAACRCDRLLPGCALRAATGRGALARRLRVTCWPGNDDRARQAMKRSSLPMVARPEGRAYVVFVAITAYSPRVDRSSSRLPLPFGKNT